MNIFTLKNRVVAAVLVTASALSHAAIDTTGILAAIADVVTAAGAVGAAVVVMHYGIKAYKWLRTAG